MRRRATALALCAAAAACAPLGPPASPAPPSVAAAGASDGTVLRRATLVVHDIDASIAFYESLGFTQWYVGVGGTVSGEGLPVEGARPGDPSQLVIMKGRHPYIGMIGLLQYGHKRALPESGRLRAGDAIMMIETVGLAEIAARLAAGGYRIHKPLERTRIKSVESEWDASFLMVFDPDGNMVELTERHN